MNLVQGRGLGAGGGVVDKPKSNQRKRVPGHIKCGLSQQESRSGDVTGSENDSFWKNVGPSSFIIEPSSFIISQRWVGGKGQGWRIFLGPAR